MADEQQDTLMEVAGLTLEQLLPIHAELQLADVPEERKTRGHVWKLILRCLTSAEVEDSDDGGQAHFLWLRNYLDGLNPPPPAEEAVVAEGVGGEGNLPPVPVLPHVPVVPAVHAPVVPAVHVPVVPAGGNPVHVPVVPGVGGNHVPLGGVAPVVVKTEPVDHTSDAVVKTLGSTLKKALQKDFKIRGSIGSPGQKDKLTFSSLAYQINKGLKKQHTDDDICDEVIRVCDGGSPLRPILEGKDDLTLASLRSILRSYFQEKDPTTMYNMMSKAVQAPGETAMKFIMDLWDLRQKVIFVTKEMDSRVRFSDDVVNDQFVRAVITGLRNDNIRNEIKVALTPEMEIDQLLEILNRAASDENERQAKLAAELREREAKAKKGAKVNKIDAETTDSDSGEDERDYRLMSEKPQKKDSCLRKDRGNPIIAKLEKMDAKLNDVSSQNTALQNEVADLKAQVQSKDVEGTQGNAVRKVRFGCQACKKAGLRNCCHCFKCGSLDHKSFDCPTRN